MNAKKLKDKELKQRLCTLNKGIGFASCIPSLTEGESLLTPYGEFDCRSPLSYHLNPLGFHRETIEKYDNMVVSVEDFTSLPVKIIDKNSPVSPMWSLSEEEKAYIDSITVTEESCRALEKDTMQQAKSKLWHYSRKRKITSSNAHKVLIRKKGFQTLVPLFLQSEQKNVPISTQDAMKHGKTYEPLARELYENSLRYHLKHEILS